MSQDIKDQVLDQVRASPVFAIQLDEMTDVAQCSQLLMYARFVSGNSVKEEMLFCHPMESYTTATDNFSSGIKLLPGKSTFVGLAGWGVY